VAQISDGRFADLKTKLLWTALWFLCFMIGRYIPIPLLHGTSTASGVELLNAANIATGGDFFSPSLFSLGLGPWMAAAILWRFLFIGRIARGRNIPEATVDRARNGFVVVLAIIQAVSLMSTYEIEELPWGPFSGLANAQIAVVVILTAGALIVARLAKLNEDRGLGGITMFILYQLIITATRNLESLAAQTLDAREAGVLWVVILACVGVVLIGIVLGNAELRLHVNKIAIDSGFMGVSYLPIKLNPAGVSPIMYSLALLTIPQSIAGATRALVPGAAEGADRFLSVWTLGSPVGLTAYLLLLFGLTIFFGLFTVDPKETAKRMRDGGEYFDGVPPGHATRRYVRNRVIFLSVVSGVFLVVFTGLPLAYMGSQPDLQFLLMAPGTLMILLGLLWMLQEEVADTRIGTRYDFAFSARVGGAAA
jgi:preprotein translocase subunit SecY